MQAACQLQVRQWRLLVNPTIAFPACCRQTDMDKLDAIFVAIGEKRFTKGSPV